MKNADRNFSSLTYYFLVKYLTPRMITFSSVHRCLTSAAPYTDVKLTSLLFGGFFPRDVLDDWLVGWLVWGLTAL